MHEISRRAPRQHAESTRTHTNATKRRLFGQYMYLILHVLRVSMKPGPTQTSSLGAPHALHETSHHPHNTLVPQLPFVWSPRVTPLTPLCFAFAVGLSFHIGRSGVKKRDSNIHASSRSPHEHLDPYRIPGAGSDPRWMLLTSSQSAKGTECPDTAHDTRSLDCLQAGSC